MSIAKKLIREIREFEQRKPKHGKSIAGLIRAIERIDSHFEGETREQLLHEARKTFLKQMETLENLDHGRESLTKLRKNHRELVEGLQRIVGDGKPRGEAQRHPRRRPDSPTIH